MPKLQQAMRVTSKRRFIDRVRVLTVGGDGGTGCVSTFSDTRVEHGPPDGGNGGKGGDVVLVASHNQSDLNLHKRNFRAGRGNNGLGADQHGKIGKVLELTVPCGTAVHRLGSVNMSQTSCMEPPDAPQTLIGELLLHGDRLTVAQGGSGGRGNGSFRPGLHQHSRVAEAGGAGEAATLLLSLKLIADVGLVGFPNAGKSSLLRALSNALPKVASYPFTTLHPHLGRVRASAHEEFTVADIPGLVDGAHANRGLGHSFLRHIERTSLLCYVLDLASEQPPVEQLLSLRRELALYQPGLQQQPCILVANKADTEGAASALRNLRTTVARMRARGDFPGLIGGSGPLTIDGDYGSGGGGGGGDGGGGGGGDGDDGSEGNEGEGGGGGSSAVTAVSALHAGNLPVLVRRMSSGLNLARRVASKRAEREKSEAARRVVEAEDMEWLRKEARLNEKAIESEEKKLRLHLRRVKRRRDRGEEAQAAAVD